MPQNFIFPLERGVKSMSINVIVKDNNIEAGIKLLRKKMQMDGLKKELKQREFYEKPSVKKKRKQREAARRKRKANLYNR
jgi:small subunit ribosomal protein S21